jgi:hypothetical protein
MPRSSGTYSLPANAEAVAGTTINPTYFNNTINDIADELTNSVAADGQSTMTGPLKVPAGSITSPAVQAAADSNTGLAFTATDTVSLVAGGTKIVEVTTTGPTVTGALTVTGKSTGQAFDANAVASLASATNMDLGAASSAVIDITGSTTITTFGTAQAGVRRLCRVSAASPPQINTNAFIALPGGANIQTEQYDVFEALSFGAGIWQVVDYQRYSGEPLIAPADFVLNRAYNDNTTWTAVSAIPHDDTIPQVGEGTEILTVSITPTSTSARLRLRATVVGAPGTNNYLIAAAFLNGAADAIRSTSVYAGATSLTMTTAVLEYEYVPGSVSAQAWAVRAGTSTGTGYVNGNSGGRLLGGTMACTLVIEEIP